MSKFGSKAGGTVPTRLVREKKTVVKSSSADATVVVGSGADLSDLESAAPATIMVDDAAPQKKASEDASGKTVVYRGAKSETAEEAGSKNQSEDPVVGWLVVVSGPGRGTSLPVHYGLNRIGRSDDQEISLNFGDDEVSRTGHAAIEFDPKPRAFYLSKGENLVYLNGSRVGQGNESELVTGDRIEVGETTLSFVAFCGPEFDWNDS